MVTNTIIQRDFRGYLLKKRFLNQLFVQYLKENSTQFVSLSNETREFYLSFILKHFTIESILKAVTLIAKNKLIETKMKDLGHS